MNAALQVLLIHSLGGPRVVAPLLDPPVEPCVVYRWASGRKSIPSERIQQLRSLQHRQASLQPTKNRR